MNNLNEHPFRLHKKQRAGIILLIGVLLILILGWQILLPRLFSPTPGTIGDYESSWEKFKSINLREVPPTTQRRFAFANDSAYSGKDKKDADSVPLFLFNPNTASETDLVALGLPVRTVRTLLNYRKKGGVFYKKEDLKKVYTLAPEDYARIEPYIQIPELPYKDWKKDKNKHTYEKSVYPKVPPTLDLNKVDAAALMELPGIGIGYSKRIIAFRDALGGFFSVAQLKEVYGFPDSTYQLLKGRFFVSPEEIQKININEADGEKFYRQPYLRPYGKKILRLRRKMGKFKNIADLKQISLINDEKYRKIAPYLTVQ